MKTEVIMKREIFNKEISQKSKSGFFSATDLIKAGNKWRSENGIDLFNLTAWFQQKNVKIFIKTLENEFGRVKISGRGRGKHTWVHPFLFIDIALAINPELKIKVYKWLYDELLKYRNSSGNSYKKMCGALYCNQSNKSEFRNYIIEIANKIKKACDVDDWQKATEKQLKLRDKIQENIFVLSDVMRHNDNLVDIAIQKAKQIQG